MSATTPSKGSSHPSTTESFTAINQEYFRAKSGTEFFEDSPHLKHPSLRQFCHQLAANAFERCSPSIRAKRVLDMGAGDGMLALPFLHLGAHVTAADATAELLQTLQTRADGYRDALTIVTGDIFDTLGNLPAAGSQFDLICASSFLHHIPDYLELCRRAFPLLAAEGVFFSLQDPIRYDTLGRSTYVFDRLSYFWWRLFQGNYTRGVKTRIRRLFGMYRDDLEADTAEYHVVRNGVDQLAIKRLFEEAGFSCEIHPYWSTQSAWFQRAGERLKLANTFGIVARRERKN